MGGGSAQKKQRAGKGEDREMLHGDSAPGKPGAPRGGSPHAGSLGFPCHEHQSAALPQHLACCPAGDLLPSHSCKICCRIERVMENKP